MSLHPYLSLAQSLLSRLSIITLFYSCTSLSSTSLISVFVHPSLSICPSLHAKSSIHSSASSAPPVSHSITTVLTTVSLSLYPSILISYFLYFHFSLYHSMPYSPSHSIPALHFSIFLPSLPFIRSMSLLCLCLSIWTSLYF